MSKLTAKELEILGTLREACDTLEELPEAHVDDAADFGFHIRACENIIMSRVAMRSNPKTFDIEDGFK